MRDLFSIGLIVFRKGCITLPKPDPDIYAIKHYQ